MPEATAVRAESWGERQKHRRTLNEGQAREVRLSLVPSIVLAKQMGVSAKTLSECRTGRKYGRLLPDERAAQELRSRREVGGFILADYLLAVGPQTTVQNLLQGQDAPEALDAAYECAHGRLAGDSTPPCGCFASETNPTPRRTHADHHADHAERLDRFAAQATRPAADRRRPTHRRPVVTSGAGQR